MRDAIATIERELRLVGRHAATGVFHGGQPSDGRLDRSAYLLLTRIDTEGPMSIGQLADAFGLDTSTVNRQTAALLRADLAARIADPGGGMARKLEITKEGRRRLRADRAWAMDGINHVLSGWSDEDLAAFATMLVRYNTAIEDTEGRQWPRDPSTVEDQA